MHTRRIILALAAAATLILASSTANASPQTNVVESFNAKLLSLLEGDSDFAGRYAVMRPAVENTFDLEFMSSKVLGRGWKDLTPEQKAEWLDTFTRLTTSNYAGRFVGEPGPSFETIEEQEGTHGTVVVRTKLVNPGEDDVELGYRLRQTPTGWKVIDCYLDGTVSEIALRRSEYGAVLRRDGFEKLVSAVNSKSDDLASGKSEPR